MGRKRKEIIPAPKRQKGRRQLQVKFILKVFVRAGSREDAIDKLRDALEEWIKTEHESFEEAAEFIAEQGVARMTMGAVKRKWWHPKAPRDVIIGKFYWRNHGGPLRPGPEGDPLKLDAPAIDISRITVHRNNLGQFSKKGKKVVLRLYRKKGKFARKVGRG